MRVYATLAIITITSAHALDFAFKSGVPTKIVITSTFQSEDDQFSSIDATLSDATNHAETISASKIFEDEAGGGYNYNCRRRSCADGKEIEIHNRSHALKLFDILRWHCRQEESKKQEAQHKKALERSNAAKRHKILYELVEKSH